MKIKVHGTTFKHATTAANGDLKINPKYFTWTYNENTPINFYVDNELFSGILDKSKKNIAWLIEPKSYMSNNYNLSKLFNRGFNYILTHDKDLIGAADNILFCPYGGSWIYPNDQKIYKKNKNISIIASAKRQLEGHKLRHQIISKYADKIDLVCGGGYFKIDYKLSALQDFRYSIVVENCRQDYWFTEKLIDCFVTGTVPIYWGCPSINKFFNIKGMLLFNSLDELDYIINEIDLLSFYNNIKDIIKENYYRSLEYIIVEDWIFNKILKPKNLI